MSMLGEQIKELREAAEKFEGYQCGEVSRMLREAADTIESLRDRLQEVQGGDEIVTDMKKCDRCGEYYAPSHKSRVIQEYYATGINSTSNGGDVCPICAAKFEKWWRKRRKEGGDE